MFLLEILSPALEEGIRKIKSSELEHFSNVFFGISRKEGVRSLVFGEEEINLPVEDEHHHQEGANH